RAIQNALGDPAILQTGGPAGRDRLVERAANHVHDAAQLRLLAQRQMIETLLHAGSLPDRHDGGKPKLNRRIASSDPGRAGTWQERSWTPNHPSPTCCET